MWQFINKERGRRKIFAENEITQAEWKAHFIEVLQGIDSEENTSTYFKQNDHNVEIETQIGKLKKQKAAGEDEIKNEALIFNKGNTKVALYQIIKDIWKGKGFPDRWRKGIIAPIFKKGEKEDPKSYRGITLLDTTYKVYALILENKLREEI